MKKISLFFEIDQNGEKKFSKTFQKKFRSFVQKNILKKIEMTLEVIDSPEYYQHKHYRGEVLPAIADAQGEMDLYYLHNFILKKQFGHHYEISKIDEIPEKHRKSCIIITKEIEGIERVVGYIRSSSTFSFEEMDIFIKNCKGILKGLIEWTVEIKNKLDEIKSHREING